MDSKYYQRYVCQHDIDAMDNIPVKPWMIVGIVGVYILSLIIICCCCWRMERKRRNREIRKLLKRAQSQSRSIDTSLIFAEQNGEMTLTPEPHSHLESEDQIVINRN